MKITLDFIKDKIQEFSDYLNNDNINTFTRYFAIGVIGMLFILLILFSFSGPIWSIVLGCTVNPYWFLTLFITFPFDFALGMFLDKKVFNN